MISFRAALALIVGVPVVVLGAAVVLQVMRDVPIRHLLSDPVEWADVPLYAGAIGYFGVLLWAATAAVLLFVAAMVGPGWTPVRTFLLRAGLITPGSASTICTPGTRRSCPSSDSTRS